MDNKAIKLSVWFNNDKIGKCTTIEDAENIIAKHPEYRKSWYTKRGYPSSKHPNQKIDGFRIYDNYGRGWTIRA